MEKQITEFYQTVGFHFSVQFNFGNGIDARFQSVSGLEVSFETESIKEGGENRFEHVIPSRRKYNDLVLKRGLIAPSGLASLNKWCKDAFDNYKFQPIDLSIHLLNEEHNALLKWDVCYAWPKAWKIGELNAEKSEVLIETFELRYNYFCFKKV